MSTSSPADPLVVETAERYLDGCQSTYRAGAHEARVVLNIRT